MVDGSFPWSPVGCLAPPAGGSGRSGGAFILAVVWGVARPADLRTGAWLRVVVRLITLGALPVSLDPVDGFRGPGRAHTQTFRDIETDI